ncbi:hypothetical protein HYV22_03390 [Candidatus Gottesmanbacteria bacterium]|nr:hypothetical protein [Candidatus Gottesmanbacteria bacterium]
MPELREALTHKVQQARGLVEKGKAKLVGTARPPKERKAYEIAAEPVTLGSEDEKLVITATGAAAVETKAAEMAEQEMQRKPGERLSLSSIARTVWKRSLGSEYFRERARLYSKELLATVNNNVFSDERIAQAKQRAEARYQQELRQANIAKKTGRRALEFAKSAIGKKTLMQQYTLEELASLTHATEEQTLVRELGQTHERFRKTLDQNDAMIRTEMGEQLHILQEATPQEKAIIDKGRKLMEDFASGALNEAQFQTESQGVWSMMKNLKPELLKAADLYTSSLFETAKALKTQRNQGVSMAVIQARIANSEFRIAFGVMGAATSIEASTTKKIVGRLEKTLNRFEKNPLGALILNEATVGGGVALGLSALLVPRSMATSAARLVAPIGGSLVGGAFGAVREYRRLGRERKVHIGEKEAGYPVSQGERRKWFEQFNVPQKNATELIDALKLPDKPTQDDLQRFMGTIADVQTRINISSRRENRLGLVTFSSPQMIETERTKLFLAMREARQKLDTVDPTLLQATTSNQTSQEFLRKAIEVRTTEINNEVEETTRRFNRARTGKAIKYGAIAAGAGMVAGEAVADVSHLTATGHVEAVGPIGQVVTALGGGVPAQTAVEELASRTQTIEPQAARARTSRSTPKARMTWCLMPMRQGTQTLPFSMI